MILFATLTVTASYAANPSTRIVSEGKIGDEWMLAENTTLIAPGYPGLFSERGDNVCMAMGYMINPDGTTSDFVLLKSWAESSGDKEPVTGFWEAFAQASAGALSQWKFKAKPEIKNPRPTYTVATMHFQGKPHIGVGPSELKSRCAISDLASFIQEKKWNKYQQIGTLEKLEMLRAQRSQENQQSYYERSVSSGEPAHVIAK